MKVMTKTSEEANRLRDLLWAAIDKSRFTAIVESCWKGRRSYVEISKIRLRIKKHYCGQHPGPCPVTPFKKKHVRSFLLEGYDWIGFDALVNDVLDKAGHDGHFTANSMEIRGTYYLRRDGRRRMFFPQLFRGPFAGWDHGEQDFDVQGCVFEDWRGKKNAPTHKDPHGLLEGTPGYPGYGVRGEAMWRKQMEEHEHEHAH